MSKLLEIFGRAITVNTADLIRHWLENIRPAKEQAGQADVLWEENEQRRIQQLSKIIGTADSIRPDAAEQQLRLYLFEYPNCIYGKMAAAAIFLYQNKLQDAIKELNSVYMRQPNNTMALYSLGHCYERIGGQSQAVEFYQDCLKFKNYLQMPRERLAAIYFKDGQLEKTTHEYEQLRKEYPDDMPTLLTLGHLYLAGNQLTKAMETFNTAILMHPDNFLAEDEDAVELVGNGQLQQGIERIEELLLQQSDRVDLMIKRADILSMLGAESEAVEQYEEAVRTCPNCLEATIKLGTGYLKMNEIKPAAQQFNRAVEINDQIVEAYIGLAMAQKAAGRESEALSTLGLAAAIQPNSSLLFAQTAVLKFEDEFGIDSRYGDEDNANLLYRVIEAHRGQISVRPQNPDLYYRLGVLMMGIEKMEEASEAFQAALELNPAYNRAESKLAVCLFMTGKREAALRRINQTRCPDKEILELHYQTALLYCDKIKFASSVMNLQNSIENNFSRADAAVNISLVLQNLGLLDRATVMWDNLSETASEAINRGELLPPADEP